jgi:hypothetical protein
MEPGRSTTPSTCRTTPRPAAAEASKLPTRKPPAGCATGSFRQLSLPPRRMRFFSTIFNLPPRLSHPNR